MTPAPDAGGNQTVWAIQDGKQVIGQLTIDLSDSNVVEAPCMQVELEVTNDSDKQDITAQAIKHAISYAYRNLPYEALNAQCRSDDTVCQAAYVAQGFAVDGDVYLDDHDLSWQNLQLVL